MNLKYHLIAALLLIINPMSKMDAQAVVAFNEVSTNVQRAQLHNAVSAQLKTDFIEKIKSSQDETISLVLPDENGNPLLIDFVSYEILSDDFRLTDQTGKSYKFDKPEFYKGSLKDGSGFATMTVFEDRISAVLSIEGHGNVHIAQDKESKNPFEYWIYNDQDWKEEIPFECHTKEEDHNPIPKEAPSDLRSVDQCVEVYLEADFIMFQDYGSTQDVMDYLTEVWVHVAALFEVEEITVNISEIFVWTTNDPYSDTNGGNALIDFMNFRTSYNGDIAHLVTTNDGNLGGIAFVDVLCTDAGYGFSNITNNFSLLPNYSWTINVLAHEIGHQLGSYHTHSCLWPSGPIDDCAPTENGPCNPGPTPTNGGTIMSYCHLTGFGIDFNNGFGPIPGDRIRAQVAAATCLTVCDPNGGGAPTADFTFDYISPCQVGAVSFADNSSGNPSTYSWQFEGGIPGTSQDETPVVQYLASGEFSVTLTVTNANGIDSEIKNDIIVIQDDPIVSSSFSVPNDPNTFEFVGSGVGINTWNWDFGDGNSSSLQSPTHTYAQNGSYDVVLTGTNDCGTAQDIFSVSVDLPPVAAFSQNKTEGCAPLSINFLDQSQNNPTEYTWQLLGGSPASSTFHSPFVTYQTPGVYDVILQVSNSSGTDVEVKQNLITVEAGPIANFISSTNGATVTFTNTGFNFNSIEWDFGDGTTSFIEDPVHTFGSNGTFVVTQTVENDCGFADIKMNITINAYPEPSFTVSSDSGCIPHLVNFNNTSINTTFVTWQFPGGTPETTSASSPDVIYETPGVYDVTMIVANGFGNATETFDQVITVGAEPEAAFDYEAIGLSFSFENQSLFGDSYVWSFGDGSISAEENPEHTFASEGTYEVSLEVTSACGTDILTNTITIFNLPSVSIETGQREFCAGDPINFTTTLSDNITDFLWTLTGPETITSDEEDPVFILTEPGNYDVRLEVSNPEGSDVEFLPGYLIIRDEPVVDFDYTVNILQVNFQSQISLATSVLWSFGDGNTSSNFNPLHNYASNGEYLVSLTAINDCGATSFSQTITVDQLTFANFTADQTSFCQGEFVQFENNSTMSSNEFLWSFPGGSPSSSTEENPMVFYDEPGVYDVSLFVNNGITEDEVIFNDFIQVDASEPFEIQNAPLIANVPTNIRFNFNNNIPGEYMWDFGDGGSSTVSSPVYQYDDEGSYEVSLNFNNSCFELDTTFILDVYSRPEPAFAVNNNEGCVPFSIVIDNQSSNNYTEIEWTAPGSVEQVSDLDTPFFTYLNPGEYDITLRLINPLFERSVTIENAVNIIDVPSANFGLDANGFDVAFNDESLYNSSQTWDFGDGNTSIAQNPSHTYAAEDSYLVTLVARNVCGRDTLTEVFNLFSPPTASFESSDREVCRPASVAFQNNSSDNALDYEWIFEGAQTTNSSMKNPVVAYDEVGIYDVTLIVHNPLFSDTMLLQNYITVNDVAETNFTFTQSGLEFDFTNLSVNADSYQWDFGDGNISVDVNPSHEYTVPGNYFVSLTTVNQCGAAAISIPVEVRAVPSANFSVNLLQQCQGSTFTFFNLSDEETTDYEWSFPGSTVPSSTEEAPTVIYNTPGFYDVRLIAHSAFGSDTLEFLNYIEVQDFPVALFDTELIGNEIHVTNNSIGADNFLWTLGSQSTVDPNPIFTVDSNGEVMIALSASNTCGTSEQVQTITINALPTIDFTLTERVCIGEVIRLESLSANVESLTWYINDELVGSGVDPVLEITLDEAGIYDVLLVGVNEFGQSELRREDVLQVVGAPIADFEFSFFGDQILFTDLSQDAIDYFWDFGDGFISITGGDQFHKFAEAGIYEVQLMVENECGSDIIVLSVDANILLPQPLFFSNNDLCVPTTLDINNETIGDVSNWFWRLTGPDTLESNLETPVFDLELPGTYDLFIEFSNQFGGSSEFFESYVVVEDVPDGEVGLTVDGLNLIYGNVDASNDEYLWDFGDGNDAMLKSGVHTFAEAGTYNIVHTASNFCGESVYNETINVEQTRVNDEEVIESLIVVDNLTVGDPIIEITGYISEPYELHVLDNLGRLIRIFEQPPLNGVSRIPLSLEPHNVKTVVQATYHVWVKALDGSKSVSFIKF